MVRRRTKQATQTVAANGEAVQAESAAAFSYCSMPEVPEPEFSADIAPGRQHLIQLLRKKWVNGTVLHYYFFDKETDGRRVPLNNGSTEWRPWTTTEAEKDVVRKAFAIWKDVGIGLEFKEVASRDEAEIRIGFMRGDGAWSYVGRDIIDVNIGRDERTMNFGWDLTRHAREIDTAIHEIGHTIGFPHEHQNPHAGIVWDEEAVYASLAQAPNNWPRETTFWNIIRKISPDDVQGSEWDPDSIMHYPFGSGLILEPAKYRTGLRPAGGLSARDKAWVKSFYPPLSQQDLIELNPFESARLALLPGEQKNFVIRPTATREYDLRTFGVSDSVMVLFEEEDGELRYLAGSDDSGAPENAQLHVKLLSGRTYVVRVRLAFADRSDETSIMLW